MSGTILLLALTKCPDSGSAAWGNSANGTNPAPVILAGPTGHRHPAIAVFPDRDPPGGNKADRAAAVGINHVLLRPDEIFERGAKPVPVGGTVDAPERFGGAVFALEKCRRQCQDMSVFGGAFRQGVGQHRGMP